jgi:septum formation protein
MTAMQLILASASPRRRQLLDEAGYQFVVQPANVDETVVPGLFPPDLAQKLATDKAQAVAGKFPEDVVLAADTLVTFGDQILGKPAGADEARRMLMLLSRTTHLVITGVCVIRKGGDLVQATRVMSAVRMNNLTPQQIDAYVASSDWQGKAGGYGIQDNDPFVTRVSGSLTNIVGLPMEVVRRLLAAAGVYPAEK